MSPAGAAVHSPVLAATLFSDAAGIKRAGFTTGSDWIVWRNSKSTQLFFFSFSFTQPVHVQNKLLLRCWLVKELCSKTQNMNTEMIIHASILYT